MSDIYHNHHIIPKHMGGSDDPSNIIQLSIGDHCDEHWINYVKFGNEYDRIATLALGGQIGKEEATRLAQVENGKINGNNNVRLKRGICGLSKEQRSMNGIKIGKRHKENNIGICGMSKEQLSIAGKIGGPVSGQKHKENNTGIFGLTKEQHSMNSKIGGKIVGSRVHTCPHCNKTGKGPIMFRLHFDRCVNKEV